MNGRRNRETVTVAITSREIGVGQRTDEATATTDSSSIVMRPTRAKRCLTDGKRDGSNEKGNKWVAD
jgi:hypothetical protein